MAPAALLRCPPTESLAGVSTRHFERARIADSDTFLELVHHADAVPPRDEWLALVPTADTTYLLRASYPSELSHSFQAELRAALQSVRVDLGANEPWLPFALEMPDLVARRYWNRIYFLSPDALACAPAKRTPALLALTVGGHLPAGNRVRAATAMLRRFTFDDQVPSDARPTPVIIDGMPGVQFRTFDTDPQTAERLTIYFVMLFDGAHNYLVVGRVDRALDQHWLPKFELAARSFRRSPP